VQRQYVVIQPHLTS